MEGKIKLKRVDFRLKPESYSVNAEALNEPGKVVDYAFGHKRKEQAVRTKPERKRIGG